LIRGQRIAVRVGLLAVVRFVLLGHELLDLRRDALVAHRRMLAARPAPELRRVRLAVDAPVHDAAGVGAGIAATVGFDALGPWGQLGLVALMALVVSAFAPGYFYRGTLVAGMLTRAAAIAVLVSKVGSRRCLLATLSVRMALHEAGAVPKTSMGCGAHATWTPVWRSLTIAVCGLTVSPLVDAVATAGKITAIKTPAAIALLSITELANAATPPQRLRL
jgi:hypothetical protein